MDATWSPGLFVFSMRHVSSALSSWNIQKLKDLSLANKQISLGSSPASEQWASSEFPLLQGEHVPHKSWGLGEKAFVQKNLSKTGVILEGVQSDQLCSACSGRWAVIGLRLHFDGVWPCPDFSRAALWSMFSRAMIWSGLILVCTPLWKPVGMPMINLFGKTKKGPIHIQRKCDSELKAIK